MRKLTDYFYSEEIYLCRTKLALIEGFLPREFRSASLDIESIAIDLPFLLKAKKEYLKLPKEEIKIFRKKAIFFSYFPFIVFSPIFFFYSIEEKRKEDITFGFLSTITLTNEQVSFLLIFSVALRGVIR